MVKEIPVFPASQLKLNPPYWALSVLIDCRVSTLCLLLPYFFRFVVDSQALGIGADYKARKGAAY